MKNFLSLLIAIFLFIGNSLIAQKFELSPEGLVNSTDKSKSFIVIEDENKTAEQLYSETLKYINENYKNPDEVIKGKTENEYLRFDTYSPDFIMIKNTGAKLFFDAKYTTELYFKDGKIKFEIISLQMLNTSNAVFPLHIKGKGLSWYVFNEKNGKLKNPEAKTQIEDFFNIQFYKLKKFITEPPKNEDW